MLPEKFKHINVEDLEPKTMKSRTWKLDYKKGEVLSTTVDESEALAQDIRHNLNVEKKGWYIHTDGFGQEFCSLYGKDMDYCRAMVPEMIQKALKWDRRIYGLTNFVIEEVGKRVLLVEFDVISCYGRFTQQVTVNV